MKFQKQLDDFVAQQAAEFDAELTKACETALAKGLGVVVVQPASVKETWLIAVTHLVPFGQVTEINGHANYKAWLVGKG